MQYDLRYTLGKLGALDMMDSINAHLRRYEEEHPPEAGDEADRDAAAREYSVALDQQGDIQQARGQIVAALESYRESLAIRQKLASKDPSNTGWQRDLAVSYNNVGNAQRIQGDLAAALKSYQGFLAIARQLTAKETANVEWQRNLLISLNNIGAVQQAQGDLAAALILLR